MDGKDLLAKERINPSFPVQKMTYLLYEDLSGKRTANIHKIRKIVESDPQMKIDDFCHLDAETRYRRSIKIVRRLEEIRIEQGLPASDRSLRMFVNMQFGTDLHFFVFVSFLKSQCDEEQAKYWVPLAENFAIIGAYAQTELGHGSNVRGLETTATYVRNTDEFEIHSPKLTSTKVILPILSPVSEIIDKWWPGCLGRTATHAIVMANLIIDGKNYGIQAFIVPVRSLDTHDPMPGVEVGDIGPTGYEAVDNGFARFTKVRIPRRNMLMRFSKVDEKGNFIPPVHEKLAYAGMVAVRANLVAGAGSILSVAVTIATRYSAIRCQFAQSENEPEMQVLDYRMQQYRIFPLIAASYALKFTGMYMMKLFTKLQQDLQNNDTSALAEVHAASAGLKTLTTTIAGDGIEACRKACGGHGYSQLSGLFVLWSNYVGVQTAEGENFLMTQQTTRYLLKAYDKGLKGQPLTGSSKYLENVTTLLGERCSAKQPSDFLNPAVILHAFTHRSARLIANTAEHLQIDIQEKGVSFFDAWNNVMVEAYRISNAHCIYIIVSNFINALDEVRRDVPELVDILTLLCNVFALFHIEQGMGDFLEDGYFDGSQAQMVRELVRQLLHQMRPHAVSLVDAFDISDYQLRSAIGCYDGNAYERLYEWAKKSPSNSEKIRKETYRDAIKPLLALGKSQVLRANL